MKVKGIVMEKKSSFVVLLTSDGCFVKAPCPAGDIRPGMEIECSLYLLERRSIFRLSSVVAAAVLLLLVLWPGPSFFGGGGEELLGYVCLDINPGVEFVVGPSGEVASARGLDPAGESLLAGFKTGENLPKAVENVIKGAATLSYLDPDSEENLIMLAVVAPEEPDILAAELQELVAKILAAEGIEKGYVSTLSATEAERHAASEAGLSLNRYLLREGLRRAGDNPNLELPDLPLYRLVLEAGEAYRGSLSPAGGGKAGKDSPGEPGLKPGFQEEHGNGKEEEKPKNQQEAGNAPAPGENTEDWRYGFGSRSSVPLSGEKE